MMTCYWVAVTTSHFTLGWLEGKPRAIASGRLPHFVQKTFSFLGMYTAHPSQAGPKAPSPKGRTKQATPWVCNSNMKLRTGRRMTNAVDATIKTS